MRKMHYTTELERKNILIAAVTAAEMNFDEDGNDSFYAFTERAYDPSSGRHLKMSPGEYTGWDDIIGCIRSGDEVDDECEEVSEEFMADIRNNIKGDGANGYWLVGIEIEFDRVILHYANEKAGCYEWFIMDLKKYACCHINIEMPDAKVRYDLANSLYGAREGRSDSTGIRIDEDFGNVRRIMTVCRDLSDDRYFLRVTEFAGI